MIVDVEFLKNFAEVAVFNGKNAELGDVIGIFSKRKYGKRYKKKAIAFAYYVAQKYGGLLRKGVKCPVRGRVKLE